METIWLQRPSSDIPWGFRLQGGQDFDLPLSVHRVTPGSVASNGLSQGDTVLKIGNVNATGISHTEAQEVIKGASNILQLTIQKCSTVSAPVSPTSTSYPCEHAGYNILSDDQDNYSTMPDYRKGSGYSGYNSNVNQPVGCNYPDNSHYDMMQGQRQPVSGYSTLPVRGANKQNTDIFRSVPQQAPPKQNKYPYTSTSGITLQMTPHIQHQIQNVPRDDYNSYTHPMSPETPETCLDSPYMRQSSNNSGHSDPDCYPQSYFKKPTPFLPTNDNKTDAASPMPIIQRQHSSLQNNGTRHDAMCVQQAVYPHQHDEAPPPPPPPVNYCQPEQYGRPSYDQRISHSRQYSQDGLQSSSYVQPPDQYNQYQHRQHQGIQVDTSTPQSQYQRQVSKSYDQVGMAEPYQRQHSFQRQTSCGIHQSTQPDQNTLQSYSRQTSRDQVPPPPPPSYTQTTFSSPPQSATGINSFDEILSPFEKFQNSNYCDKLFARSPDNRVDDNGAMLSNSMSDLPRHNLSANISAYSPSAQSYPVAYDNPEGSQTSLLRPAVAGQPTPAVTPPPPPPPPPPNDWAPTQRKLPPSQGQPDIGGQQQMPDKVLNTMLKNSGSQKPFAYVPTGSDLKEFKERARQRRQPRNVMPRGYVGPDLDVEESLGEEQQPRSSKLKPSGPHVPESGVYKHAQYNSPLRMYSDSNARDALNTQSGGNMDIVGVKNTPDRRPSDIKDSEVYKMIKAADAQGKNVSQVSDLETEADKLMQTRDEASVNMITGYRGHGLSFRVLQWITNSADMKTKDELIDESYKPKKPRNPLLRHNSEDDEMRFSGLHSKADIPSKAFQRLNKLAINDTGFTAEDVQNANEQQNNDTGEAERIGNYNEASIRYRGNHIPSPSFRLLQSLAKTEETNASSGSLASRTDDEDDGLPDKLSEEDMVDKRYHGSQPPSEAFTAHQGTNKPEKGPPAEPTDNSTKINVISRSPKTAPKAADRPRTPLFKPQRTESPSTDF